MLIEAGWHPIADVTEVEILILATTLQTLVRYGSDMHEFEGVSWRHSNPKLKTKTCSCPN